MPANAATSRMVNSFKQLAARSRSVLFKLGRSSWQCFEELSTASKNMLVLAAHCRVREMRRTMPMAPAVFGKFLADRCSESRMYPWNTSCIPKTDLRCYRHQSNRQCSFGSLCRVLQHLRSEYQRALQCWLQICSLFNAQYQG